MILNTHLDADGGSPAIKIKSTAKLLSMMSDNDLCDIFPIRNPETRSYTWRRKTPFKQRRLDFFLVSDSIQENVQLVDIIPSVGSDHSAIKIILYSLRENSRGRSYWKFNSSLAEDKSFVESLKKEISDFVKHYCLTKISIRAKRSISRVFSLFSRSQPLFCTLPVQRPY